MNISSTLCPFGEIIVKARKNKGISRYRLAQLIKRTPQQLAKIEKGLNEPRISTILMIAQALDLDPHELFRETVAAMNESFTRLSTKQ